MPDIAMCQNKNCNLSYNCWRFNAPPDRVAQAYADFEQDDEGNCGFYIPMDKQDFPDDYNGFTDTEL